MKIHRDVLILLYWLLIVISGLCICGPDISFFAGLFYGAIGALGFGLVDRVLGVK